MWEGWYAEIVGELGYSRERDEEAAKILDELIGDRNLTFAELRLRVGGCLLYTSPSPRDRG